MPRNRRHSYHYRDLDEGPPPPPGPNPRDYRIEVKPVAVQPHEPEQWYWHLYFKGEKVNGGIAGTEEWAREHAYSYQFAHHRDMFLRRNFWDDEEARWIYREVF